jgi:NPCBM/NEW2 domain-containing protein/chitobiase/beta-hexosaminidase-like protein
VERPYFFEKTTLVTLTCPLLKDAGIRYTLDGSAPNATSSIYEKPLHLRETTTLRTAAFRYGQKVSLEGRGFYAHLGPVPPHPDVYLDQIEPMKENYPYWYSSWHPVLNRSFEGKKLLMRGRTYQKGVGMRAPGNLRYGLKPEYDRFVARVGVDGNLRQAPPADYGLFVDKVPSKPREGGMGELFAQQPSIQFRLFIDGEMVAESPLMRFSQEPWRFDVKIPPGSRLLNLTVTDAGSRSVLDLADWADAGFIVRNVTNPK